jgi:hypothetical protein
VDLAASTAPSRELGTPETTTQVHPGLFTKLILAASGGDVIIGEMERVVARDSRVGVVVRERSAIMIHIISIAERRSCGTDKTNDPEMQSRVLVPTKEEINPSVVGMPARRWTNSDEEGGVGVGARWPEGSRFRAAGSRRNQQDK